MQTPIHLRYTRIVYGASDGRVVARIPAGQYAWIDGEPPQELELPVPAVVMEGDPPLTSVRRILFERVEPSFKPVAQTLGWNAAVYRPKEPK